MPDPIKNFRAQYPQYSDIPDDQLLQNLHQAQYSDVPFDKFQAAFSVKYGGEIKTKRRAEPTQNVTGQYQGRGGQIRPVTELQNNRQPQALPTVKPQQQGEQIPKADDYVDAMTSPAQGKFQGNFGESLLEAANRGTISFDLDQKAYEASVGRANWDDVKNEYAKLQYKMRTAKLGDDGLLNRAVLGAAEMLPGMMKGYGEGVLTGLGFAATAAAAGQAGPQALLPEEAITIPTAAMAGMGIGSTQAWYRQGTGQIYADMRQGGVDHNIAAIVSQVSGMPYAMIEVSQAGKVIPGLRPAFFRAVRGAVPEIVRRMAVKYGKDWAQETGEEVLQEMVAVSAEIIGKKWNNITEGTNLATPEIKDIVNRLWNTGVDAALSLGVLVLPGKVAQTGKSGYDKIQENRQKKQAQQSEIDRQARISTIPEGRRVKYGQTLEEYKRQKLNERINAKEGGEFAQAAEQKQMNKSAIRETLDGIRSDREKSDSPTPLEPVDFRNVAFKNDFDEVATVPVENEDLTKISDSKIIPFLSEYYNFSDDQILAMDRQARLYYYTGGREGVVKPDIEKRIQEIAEQAKIDSEATKTVEPAPTPSQPEIEQPTPESVAGNEAIETAAVEQPVEKPKKLPVEKPAKKQNAPLSETTYNVKGKIPETGILDREFVTGKEHETNTGRKTTPFPNMNFASDRTAKLTMQRIDKWLIENAVAEAKQRGDDVNERIFSNENYKSLPVASRQSMEEYLFGEYIPPVKKIFKEVIPKTEPVVEQTPKTNVQITYNAEKEGIELRFAEKPDQGFIDRLKTAGFKWSRRGFWYAKDTPSRRRLAKLTMQQIDGEEALLRFNEETKKPAKESTSEEAKPEPKKPTVEETKISNREKFFNNRVEKIQAETELDALAPDGEWNNLIVDDVKYGYINQAQKDQLEGLIRTKYNALAATQEKPTSTQVETPKEGEISPEQRNLIENIYFELYADGIKNNPALYKLADDAYGKTSAQGGYNTQDAYNALEAAIVKVLSRERARLSTDNITDFINRVDVLVTNKIPTQAARTQEKDELQQFSTPPLLSFFVNRLANIGNNDVVLEPSAGTGMLLPFVPGGAKVYANEIDPKRAAILRYLGYETTSVDAEILDDVLPDQVKPTVIVMNPPFSSTGGRIKKNSTEFGLRHIRQALRRLEPNGRLVAILGESAYIDRVTIQPFWEEIAGKYNIKAMLKTPGDLYRKFGTTFGNTIVVIDNDGSTPGADFKEQINSFNPQEANTITEAWDYINEVNTEKARPAIEPGEQKAKPGTTVVEQSPTTVRGSDSGTAATATRGSGVQQPGQRGSAKPDGARESSSSNTPVSASKPESVTEKPGQTAEKGTDTGSVETIRKPVSIDDDVFAREDQLRKREEEQGGRFLEYVPQKLKIKGAKKHPAKVVEAGTMAAVEPPDISYTPKLPKELVESGALSELQLESIAYAGQQHSIKLPNGKRGGFFVGDGTGIGKGRIISGIIYDNFLQNRKKTLWVSISTDLYDAAQGDLSDIGYPGKTALINEFNANDDIGLPEGVVFTTYSSLISKSQSGKTRLQQIEKWLGKDGVIVFDEAHKAKNALATTMGEPSQTGVAVVQIQDDLPDARIVYSSATGATDVRNMAYMTRTGLWGEGTPFVDFTDFMLQIERGGVGAMEMVARDMKALGKYVSRFISFDGVKYDKLEHALTPEQQEMYNKAATAWQVVLKNINDALGITNASSRAKAFAMQRFWNDHQRFFRNIITAMKLPTVIEKIDQAIAENKSVVVSLQTTGESRTKALVNKAIGEGVSLEELDFTPREVIGALVESAFPTQLYQETTDANGNIVKTAVKDAAGNPVQSKEAIRLREQLLDSLSDLNLPDNPIDQIINYFGHENVAELTGRKKRVIRDKKTGKVEYEKRNPEGIAQKDVNLWEMENFQSGRKRIAVFSDAASTGISLHASKSAKNQQQRVHIILELGWSSDKEMQRLGRTHRSNQAHPPHYYISATDVGGEKRFMSTIAKRMESMGALTRGQKDTGVDPLSEYNFETREGSAALTRLYQHILAGEDVPFLENPQQTLRDMGILGEDNKGNTGISNETMLDVTRFLNRILALPIQEQNALFDFYIQLLDETVKQSKESGQFDDGVSDIKGENIEFVQPPQLVYTDELTGAKTYYFLLQSEVPVQKLTFESAERTQKANSKNVKFYKQVRSGHIVLAMAGGARTDQRTGRSIQTMITMNYNTKKYVVENSEFSDKYVEVSPAEAKDWWNSKIAETPDTEIQKTHIIGGVLLPIWNKLQTALGVAQETELQNKPKSMKVVRATTAKGDRVVGVRIPESSVGNVLYALNIKQDLSTPADIYNAVMVQDQLITLIGNKKLLRSKLRGESVIEVLNVSSNEIDRFRNYGLINERLDWKQRFFIPSEEEAALPILEKVLRDYPVFSKDDGAQASYGSPTLSQSDTGRTKEVNRPPKMTKERKERQEKKRQLKQQQIAIEDAKQAKEAVHEMIRKRRAEIDLGAFETNLFVNDIEDNLTKAQREVIPFLIEKTPVPPALNRPDLEAEYHQMYNNPFVMEWVDRIQSHFTASWEFMQENIADFSAEQIEDYVTHVWDLRKGKKAKVRQAVNWFVTNNRFLKKRHVETLYRGIEELGLTPRTLDIGEIIKIHDAMMYRTIANNNFAKSVANLRKDGVPLVARVDVAPADWVYFDHPAMQKQLIIPGRAERGEIISDELAWILNEMGVEIGRRISGTAWGKPVRKQGEYRRGNPAQIRLQRFFENRTIAHEIGHHIDQALNLGPQFLNQYKTELYAVNRERIQMLSAIGKQSYAESPSEQIAEFFAYLFVDPKKVEKLAPHAMADVLERMAENDSLTKLLNLDWENKAKMLIQETVNTRFKLPVKVHPDIAKPLKVVFDQRFEDSAGIIRGLEMINGTLKKTWLSISLFHHGALAETGVGVMGPAKTFKLVNPYSFVYRGLYKGDNLAFAKADVARDAIEHGLQLGASSDIPVQKIQMALNTFAERTRHVALLRNITNFIATFNSKWDRALWDYLHDGLKIYAYEHLVSSGKYVDRKSKREIAQFVNDTFGGQNWDNLMLNPKTIQMMSWTLLSPDWTVSTVRQGLAFTGLGKVYSDTVAVRRKAGAMFWVKALFYFLAGVNMLNWLFRKWDEEENPEYYTGKKREWWEYTLLGNTIGQRSNLFVGRYEDGSERYIRWGKQFREVLELFVDAGEFSPITAIKNRAASKAAPLLQKIPEITAGVTLSGYKNRDIYGKKGNEQAIGIFKTLVMSPLPFTSRSLMQPGKEFYMSDLAFPSSKGMTRYRAVDFFKTAIEQKDDQLFRDTYQGAIGNGLDAYELFGSALQLVRAENTKSQKETLKSIEDAQKALQNADSFRDKRAIRQYIGKQQAMKRRFEASKKMLDAGYKKFRLQTMDDEYSTLRGKQSKGTLTARERARLEELTRLRQQIMRGN